MPLGPVTNVFAGNPLDRASARRSDEAWVAEQFAAPDARMLALWNGVPLLTREGETWRVAYLPPGLAGQLAPTDERRLFLGLDGDTPVFAIDLDAPEDPSAGPLEGLGSFVDLRQSALQMAIPDTGLLATAKGVFEWRRRHRYCAACGQPSAPSDGGWKRICPSCKTQHFPRVDPCVIMLPTFGERCLLGRQASWPEGRYSALAGFLEPGESIEEACAREVLEESGLTVTAVRHHSSQPWPWPSNLMIGLIAEVSDDQAAPDETELESVIWLTRAETRDLLEGRRADLLPPGEIAIARQLVAAWAYE